MYNYALDLLSDYPFDRLRDLLGGLQPPDDQTLMMMSLGEPQHQPPSFVAEIIAEHSHDWGKYPPVIGTPSVLQAIVEWLCGRYKLPEGFLGLNENVVAVNGTKEALFMIGDLSIPQTTPNQPPVVLIPNPFYQVYMGAAVIKGAKPVYLSATKETGFLPDFQSLDETILKQTSLAYLCSPSNPQGAVANIQYLKSVVELARRYDFVLAVDECYAEIYDTVQPPGILQACFEIGRGLNNVLSLQSLSKRSNVPGIRSGFVAGDEKLIAKLKVLRNYGGAAVPLPLLAASEALWRDEKHVEDNRALYRRKFEAADQVLGNRFEYYRPEGGFYLWLNVDDGETAAKRLWTNAGVSVVPGLYLSKTEPNDTSPGDKYIRVALVHKQEFVTEALNRLVRVL